MITNAFGSSLVLTVALCCGGMTLTSCASKSSGGSNLQAGNAQDLQGFWKVWATLPGQPERGPDALFLSVANSIISGPDVTGTAVGSTFQIIATENNDTTTADGVLDSSTAAHGTYTTTRASGPTETGTFRMEKFTPTGTFAVTGTILGASVTHSTNTAIGIRDYSDLGLTVLREIEVVTGSASLNFELDIEPTNLALGMLSVGTGATDVGVAIEFSTGTLAARPIAVGGSMNVTRIDDTGFAATFSLDLNTNDTITGSLDVRFELNAFDP